MSDIIERLAAVTLSIENAHNDDIGLPYGARKTLCERDRGVAKKYLNALTIDDHLSEIAHKLGKQDKMLALWVIHDGEINDVKWFMGAPEIFYGGGE
jgi:hypothetical protein